MSTKPAKPAKAKKAWKGERRSGPAPARHIPWPEIFKHHISVVEGHTKMLEMVQKHTVEGTGNYTTITNLVKRGHEMFRQAKEISRIFIPPAGQREMVPLGSSSDSMYPGYSPAHIEYGKAAEEVGQAAGQMRARGENWELPTDGPEYKLGQAHGAKRNALHKKDKSGDGGSEHKPKETPLESQEGKEQGNGEEARENQYFVIDTNPTPVDLPSRSSKKRAAADEGDEKKEKEKKKKKEKETVDVIETEDISAEVEARLKAKAEKAKSKEEKKRKRESVGDESEKILKKSKKEKSKKREAENGCEGSVDGEGKQKKLKKRKEMDTE